MIVIGPTPRHEGRGGLGLATSLRLGGSEDLRLRSEATEDLGLSGVALGGPKGGPRGDNYN